MPLVQAIPRSQTDGTILTQFLDTTSTTTVTYTYPIEQTGLHVVNKGASDIFVSVGIYTNIRIAPNEKWKVDTNYSSFSIYSIVNSQMFLATARIVKFEDISVVANQLSTVSTKVDTVTAQLADIAIVYNSNNVNDEVGLQTLINQARDGARIKVVGNTMLNSMVSVIGKNLSLEFERNALITKNFEGIALTLKGGWDNPYNVSGITLSGDNLRSIISGNFTTSDFKVGDVVKIMSDDYYTNRRYNIKKAEFFVVTAVSNGTITTNKILKNTYLSSARIVKIKDIAINIENATFTSDFNGACVEIGGTKGSKFRNVRAIKNDGQFIVLNSNYGMELAGIEADYLTDDIANGKYGYCINDKGSCNTIIKDSNSRMCRHFYTTNSLISNGTSDFDFYGEPMDVSVNNCVSDGASNAAFDTHENGYNITFNNCHAINSPTSGFHARNDTVTFNNCSATNTFLGFTVRNFDGTNAVRNVKLKSCSTVNISGRSFLTYSDDGVPIDNEIVLDNCNFECKLEPLRVELANVRVNNSSLKSLTSTSCILLINSTLNGFNVESSPGDANTNVKGVVINSESTVDIKNLFVNVPSATTVNLVYSSDTATNNKVYLKDFVTSGIVRADRPLENIGTYSDYRFNFKESNGNVSSSYWYQAGLTGPIDFDVVKWLYDPIIYVYFGHSGATINSIGNGGFPGQQLTIYNNSGTVLTFAKPPINIANTTLPAYKTVTFIWDKTMGKWNEISRTS